MDEEIVKQMLDELFASFEKLETQSAALSLFLKGQGIATEESLAPYFEQASTTSEVRWRAARVRMGALLSSALKTPEPVHEENAAKTQEKNEKPTTEPEAKEAETASPELKSEDAKNEAEGTNPTKDTVESTEKNPDNSHDNKDEKKAAA